ncbi:hypothetical protein COOONC_08617 [Cooperia oncophora]
MALKMNSKKTAGKASVQEPETDEEDYEVADLSAIPTPKVEFVMPNLTPLDSCKVEYPSNFCRQPHVSQLNYWTSKLFDR